MPAVVATVVATVVAALTLGACSSGKGGSGGYPGASYDPVPTNSSSDSGVGGTGGTGSLASNTAPKHAPDICSLITRTEAQAALGVPAAAGVADSQVQPGAGLVGNCVYRAADAKAHPLALLTIAVIGTLVSPGSFENQVHTRAPDAKRVTGVGNEAFALPGTLFVFDNGLVLSVHLSTGPNPVPIATLVPLARTALGRSKPLR
jgi:hypothetical protein